MCLTFGGAATLAHADTATRYVRDWMSVPLHESASADSRNVLPGLATGTELALLQNEERNGFSQVRTGNGVEGWIATRYLMSEPTARMQLDGINKELGELRALNAALKAEQANIPLDKREATQQLTQLKSDNEHLQSDLQTLQQAPDNATQLAQENIELKKDNVALHAQIDSNTTELAELRRNKNYALFREGGIAVLAGALLTLLVANFWPRKKSEWF
jgi:SH3 domain protein